MVLFSKVSSHCIVFLPPVLYIICLLKYLVILGCVSIFKSGALKAIWRLLAGSWALPTVCFNGRFLGESIVLAFLLLFI